jgi:hypothetical protein
MPFSLLTVEGARADSDGDHSRMYDVLWYPGIDSVSGVTKVLGTGVMAPAQKTAGIVVKIMNDKTTKSLPSGRPQNMDRVFSETQDCKMSRVMPFDFQ